MDQKVNSKKVQKVARAAFQTAWLWIENSFVYDWESDVFWVMRTSKYAIEIEVKISRSDFFADMKKPKHNLFKNRSGRVSRLKKHGYKYVAGQAVYWSEIEFIEIAELIPNQFYFAVPEGLIKPEEVPFYAGLIEVRSGNYGSKYAYIRKKAPYLHKEKRMDILAPVLMEKYWYRLNTLESKLSEMKGGQLWLS